jgi:hypothetical protein
MKAIHLIAILSLLLLVIACVPSAEELAGVNNTTKEEKEPEPEVEVKQEITVIPDAHDNTTITEPEKKENKTNTTNSITTTTPPPQIAGSTIVYSGGAIEMGEGESAKIIIK